MSAIFDSYVIELKNSKKTKICSYCGKPIKKEQLPVIESDELLEKYSCNCSDWIDNVESRFIEELNDYKEQKIIASLQAAYNPTIHGKRAEYLTYCILISRGETEEAAEVLKKAQTRLKHYNKITEQAKALKQNT